MTMNTELPISLLKKDLIILELRAELAEAHRVIASHEHRRIAERLRDLEEIQREQPETPAERAAARDAAEALAAQSPAGATPCDQADREWLTDGDIA